MLESDILSLSSKFWVNGNLLIDHQLLLKHRIAAKAAPLLQPLMGMVTFSELQYFSDQLQLERNELHTILGFLNSIGALAVSRNSKIQTTKVVFQHAMHGVLYAPVAYRKTATLSSITQGSLRASVPFMAASFISALIICASGAVPWASSFVFYPIFLASFICSLILHEAIHGLYANSSATQPVILQVGMQLNMLHRPLPRKTEVTSAVVGPLVGSILCLGVAILWQQFINIPWQSCLLSALSITHIGALLPHYSDGKSLRAAFKER